jgi:hypothetical protein
LVIARDHAENSQWFSCGLGEANDDLGDYELWRVVKEQVRILREDMDSSEPEDPKPGPDFTFSHKAERSAPGDIAAVDSTGSAPFDKVEFGRSKRSILNSIPVFSRRLTPTEAMLALHVGTPADDKIWG